MYNFIIFRGTQKFLRASSTRNDYNSNPQKSLLVHPRFDRILTPFLVYQLPKQTMGGDGGTLNNSRHEHTRLRNNILQRPDPSELAARLRQTSSTTHCALTKEPLQSRYIVADRLGQLYNKEALLRHLLQHRQQHDQNNILLHIRSVKKDIIPVHLHADADDIEHFVCPVTKRRVTDNGRFSLHWPCGCVTSNSIPDLDTQKTSCVACGKSVTERIVLGMTLEDRLRIQSDIVEQRRKRKMDKKENSSSAKLKKRKISQVLVDSDIKAVGEDRSAVKVVRVDVAHGNKASSI